MKDDNKSLSFVEDTAVAPEKLRDYIAEFLALVARDRQLRGQQVRSEARCAELLGLEREARGELDAVGAELFAKAR